MFSKSGLRKIFLAVPTENFPDMKLVWPNIGRASGVRPQGVQRWVSMLLMTDLTKGQGAEASSLPLSFQESFERGPLAVMLSLPTDPVDRQGHNLASSTRNSSAPGLF